MMSPNVEALDRTLSRARDTLLSLRNSSGRWTGELASSALSTATALCALTLVTRSLPRSLEIDALIEGARGWLLGHQNRDGGWGDTVESPSNLSTTTLCWAALGLDREPADTALDRAGSWLRGQLGELTPGALAAGIRRRYGSDRTFSVPILTLCALAGRLGEGRAAWREIPPLPFELAVLPRGWLPRLGLPVVSYALPALIAIGQVQHHRAPSRNPLLRLLRSSARSRTLRVLDRIQPGSGGFLEAAPLTAFVAMSLAGSGLAEHPLTRKAVRFLVDSARGDGSWPIDTNLRLWLSTLSVKALAGDGRLEQQLSARDRKALRDWLLEQQSRSVHPYTLAPPGGWAWTDLSGGVPDADDTSGALLALRHLCGDESAGPAIRDSARAGAQWLLDLQNRDGGIPTFCRGWGKFPFDRSSPDLTAHALRAWLAWRGDLQQLGGRVDRAAARALRYLMGVQRLDGSWIPLWFGNQQQEEQCNPLYGTSRVLRIPDLPGIRNRSVGEAWQQARERAVGWLLEAQQPDGGWGGDRGLVPTIEETSLAVETLADLLARPGAGQSRLEDSMRGGCGWLIRNTDEGRRFDPAPIGLYFARLWYHERLYPVIFTVAALTRARPLLREGAARAS